MVSGQITKSTGGPEALEERNSVTSGIHRSVGQPARRSWGRLVCTSRKTKPLSTGSGRSMLPMSTHESTPLTDHRHGTAKNTRTRAEPIQGPRTDNHWAKPSLTKSRRDHGSKPYPPKTHVPRRASRAAPKMTNRQRPGDARSATPILLAKKRCRCPTQLERVWNTPPANAPPNSSQPPKRQTTRCCGGTFDKDATPAEDRPPIPKQQEADHNRSRTQEPCLWRTPPPATTVEDDDQPVSRKVLIPRAWPPKVVLYLPV